MLYIRIESTCEKTEEMNVRHATVPFIGGKDCTLYLHRVLEVKSTAVVLLITFASINFKSSKCSTKEFLTELIRYSFFFNFV